MKLNGNYYSDWRELKGKIGDDIYIFLQEWYSSESWVIGHTSGSTGKPKEIRLYKEDMRASARITNDFFGIDAHSVLLLCLSVSYIAGKMMVVRALEADATLITLEVSSRPFRGVTVEGGQLFAGGWKGKVDLAAMVPMQVEETSNYPGEMSVFSAVSHLLIGGASVSPVLEEKLKIIPTHCFVTYGMTETVSHVALRRLDGHSQYKAVGDVSFSADVRGCLVIRAPHLQTCEFITNDLVKLSNTTCFEWLGRYDNVINSGGLKFFPEVIESKIASLLDNRFYITSLPDERLGQRLVLVVEGQRWEGQRLQLLFKEMGLRLTPYEIPKEILFCPRFRETESGKVIREGLSS